ncbi:unnamed protein product [Symbiodinium sp. CCMP2592]|nr:unnamed protein product [Symbiodinium sp. CCMP2592]
MPDTLPAGIVPEVMSSEPKSFISRRALNGRKARIVTFLEGDLLLVEVGSCWQLAVVSAFGVKPLSPGQIVQVPPAGASDSAPFGSMGGPPTWVMIRKAFVEHDTNEVFYEVDRIPRTAPQQQMPATSLLPSCIRGMTAGPSRAVPKLPSAEQPCSFTTASGAQEAFMIHFPWGFNDASRNWGEVVRWPLLVFLHGSGGGTFMTLCRKDLPNPGLEYAVRNFVIVCPKCRWKWKNPADPWVLELVEELAGAHWVDPTRIYLSGISMGGMGTWELAMRSPQRFAALAPVGAYHKTDLRSQIAAAVKHLPIYCVQATQDVTCPFAKEVELYKELIALRARLKVDVHETHPHERIHYAFAEGPEIFQWLLSHQNPWATIPSHGACAYDV